MAESVWLVRMASALFCSHPRWAHCVWRTRTSRSRSSPPQTNLPLTVRDFDVAVTLEEPTESSRVIKQHLTPYVLRLYATPEYLRNAPPIRSIDDLAGHTLIWYVDRLMDVASLRVVHDLLPVGVRIQSTNITAIWQAAAAGVGIAPIPAFMAVNDLRLVRVLPELEFPGDYWLVLPREHAYLARAQAIVRVIESLVKNREKEITGRP